jgi:hypothetical protein
MTKNELGNVAPLSVGSGKLELTEELRDLLCSTIDKETEEVPCITPMSAWTGDYRGFSDYHTRPEFAQVFEKIGVVVREYCWDLGINADKFNFHVVRAWGAKANEKESINIHNHCYAHLSLVYYPSAEDGMLIFSVDHPPNEIIPSLFVHESYDSGIISPEAPGVSCSIAYQPEDDMYVVFPAKTNHRTEPFEREGYSRYSMAVDIILTLKEPRFNEGGVPNVDEWSTI